MQSWSPGDATCIGFKFGHHIALDYPILIIGYYWVGIFVSLSLIS